MQKHKSLKIILCNYLEKILSGQKHWSVYSFSHSRIIFSIYNQSLFFILHKVICMICDQVDGFCFPLLQKDYYAFHKYIDPFCFSLLQKDIDTFSQAFLCFFFLLINPADNFILTHEKKYTIFISFMVMLTLFAFLLFRKRTLCFTSILMLVFFFPSKILIPF